MGLDGSHFTFHGMKQVLLKFKKQMRNVYSDPGSSFLLLIVFKHHNKLTVVHTINSLYCKIISEINYHSEVTLIIEEKCLTC